MSLTSGTALVTAEQLAELPDDRVRRELIHGVLRMMSPAGGRHGAIAARINALLWNHVEANSLGRVFAAETGFLLSKHPDTVCAPNVAFVRSERLEKLDDMIGYVPVPPDLVVELVSPHDRFSEVEAKALVWLHHGVTAVVIADPENRTVQVCRGDKQVEWLHASSSLDLDDVVPGWQVQISDLFG